jgi:hypothetical protein
MNEPLTIWARITLRLALVLLAIGLVPLLLQATILPQIDPVVPVLLSFMVAPLGAACLLIAVILFLAALVRRPPGSS